MQNQKGAYEQQVVGCRGNCFDVHAGPYFDGWGRGLQALVGGRSFIRFEGERAGQQRLENAAFDARPYIAGPHVSRSYFPRSYVEQSEIRSVPFDQQQLQPQFHAVESPEWADVQFDAVDQEFKGLVAIELQRLERPLKFGRGLQRQSGIRQYARGPLLRFRAKSSGGHSLNTSKTNKTAKTNNTGNKTNNTANKTNKTGSKTNNTANNTNQKTNTGFKGNTLAATGNTGIAGPQTTNAQAGNTGTGQKTTTGNTGTGQKKTTGNAGPTTVTETKTTVTDTKVTGPTTTTTGDTTVTTAGTKVTGTKTTVTETKTTGTPTTGTGKTGTGTGKTGTGTTTAGTGSKTGKGTGGKNGKGGGRPQFGIVNGQLQRVIPGDDGGWVAADPDATVVAPDTMSAVQAFSGQPIADPTVAITLVNPPETETPVNFSLGEDPGNLEAGFAAQSNVDGPRLITFDRGEQFGEAQYTLQPGLAYKFIKTDNGWDLRTVTH